MTDFTYPRKEKLKQKKEIDLLFANGKWKTVGNLRLITLDLEKKSSLNFLVDNQKFGVSVSKRNFKKAVDRNRIKRMLREVYRHNKTIFTESYGTRSISMLFWMSKEKPESLETLEQNFLTLCKSKK